MKNKNLLLFVVLSMLMTGVYMAVMNRIYPPQKVAAAPSAPAPAAPSTSEINKPQSPAAAPAVALPVAHSATHVVGQGDLRLHFRVSDGALLQVEWLKDGTRFFPEAEASKDIEAFPGIGGALNTVFDRVGEERLVDGIAVHFENSSGDRLSYRLPSHGYVTQVEWATTRGAHLMLVRLPSDLKPVSHLGRVFTLGENGLNAVDWTGLLKDPFFSFFGAKRKVLPPGTTRLGLDAGVEANRAVQTTHFFSALWDLPRLPERDVTTYPGYHLAPDTGGKATARLYLGPKESAALAAFGPAFTQVVDYGFFGAIAKLLFLVLKALHSVLRNWGWAIFFFSVLLRLALWPFNTKTTMNMLRMKELEPHQKALQAKYEKFGNDMAKKAEMQKELMEFYKKNGHNPFGGCLPMLVQMPIFLALWSMLGNVYELRHAPWIFWIQDLSTKDPYFILPVAMGISMFVQQLATPAMGDPAQRKMMLIMMPAMMTFMFAQSAAGLALYYLLFNLVSLFQTWWIKRSYVPQPVTL